MAELQQGQFKMDGDTAIEKSIKNFVYSKIQEQVHLDVSKSNTICIKHRSHHGSIALAMFWLRVLRHQNNYPMPKYPYKDVYDKLGNNKVILKVDSVSLTTFLSSGMLSIQGMFVLEWFLNTFQAIMDSYDAPVRSPQLNDATIYRVHTENWKKMSEDDREKQEKEQTEIRSKEDEALSLAVDRASIINRLCGEKNRTVEAPETETTEKVDEVTESEKLQTAANLMAEELAEELELLSQNLWSQEVLDTQLQKLHTASVRDGATYIYKLWKSLLNHWFSDPSCKLYIVTPSLDVQRLTDICKIILEHRLTANMDALFVCQKCDPELSIFEVKQNVLNQFDAKDQMFLEYKIYSSIIYPVKSFNTSFVGCIRGDSAEVLVTSASFHGNSFASANMGSVHYQKMSDVDFIRKFLGPINESVKIQK